ncbi:MAG TPA: hypothetical protein VGL78_14475 [Solirubrobacteraceae bacterium]
MALAREALAEIEQAKRCHAIRRQRVWRERVVGRGAASCSPPAPLAA